MIRKLFRWCVAKHPTKVLCLDASITIVTWDEVCII